MGRLLIFVLIVIVLVLAVGGIVYLFQNRQEAFKRGLGGSKKRLAELESTADRQTDALKEIRDIATSSEITSGDPLWSLVVDKVDQALEREDKE